ncbi:MAG: FadR/GntR family transcriptional regulator [Candidatus Dormibacteraceae bacterium]
MTEELRAIGRMDLFKEVLRRIEAHIEERGLQAGDRLPSDRELAAALQVSRPLVRQALKVLEGLGRVVAYQGSGTFVADGAHQVAVTELTRGLAFDPDLLRDLVPARRAVDLEVLRSAFSVRGPETLAVLQRALAERTEHLESGDTEPEEGLDLSFEAALGRVCGNEVLHRFQALVHDVWLQAQIAVATAPEDRFRLHREHEAVFRAFEAGELDAALELMARHLEGLAGPSG